MAFKLVLLLIGVWSISTVCLSQEERRVDSLKQVLRISSKKEKQTPYLSLCFEYVSSKPLVAIRYADSSYRLAVANADSDQIVTTARVIGQIYNKIGELDSSIQILLTVFSLAKRLKSIKEYKKISNLLGVNYTWKANYAEALKYNFLSLEVREAEGDKAELSISYNNIAVVYFKLEDFERALQYYNKSLAMKNEASVTYDLDRLYINIGFCYNQLKNFKEGLKFINQGLKICSGNCDKAIQMEGKYGLAIALKEMKKYDEAIDELNQADSLAKQLGNVRFQLEILKSLARINIKLKKENIAEAQLKDAENMATGTPYSHILVEIYREFSTLYNQKKDFEKAARYQNLYILLNDSIFNQKLIKDLTTIQNNFDQRVNIKTIADKNAVLALKEETLKRRESEALFYIIVAALVFVLATLMFMLFRLTQRANNLLEVRVEKRTRELNNSNEALAKVNGELDNFIYKTSHDIRGPLASLKGICNVAIMDVHDEAALGYLQKLDFTAEKLNRILTRLLIINQINHAVLAANVIVFEELFEDIIFLERKKGIPKRLKIFYEIEKGFILKSDKEMLRIVLENLIDNGIKFYNESDRIEPFVKVCVHAEGNQVIVNVIDNGVGISPDAREKIFQMFVRASERSETGGIGLYLSRLATGRLEGKIDFRTTSENFTEFSVTLPLDLAPILEARAQSERIHDFEIINRPEKQPGFSFGLGRV